MVISRLRSFAAVVKYGSFTRAAEELYLSQPTVSTHIRALEEQLGCQLIVRTTKSVEITRKGRQMYDYAAGILELWDRAVRTCRNGERDIIHLGASTIPSAYILPDILPEYGKRNPDTYFVIHQSDSQGIADGLEEGRFDLGLIGMRPESAALDCRAFYRDDMVLVTPVTDRYLALQACPVTPVEELLKEPIILREAGSGSGKNAAGYLERLGVSERDLNVVARVNDQEAVKNLVAGGLGVSILSAKAAERFVREKRLLRFSLPDAVPRDIFLVWRRGASLSGRVREFMAFVLKTENWEKPGHEGMVK